MNNSLKYFQEECIKNFLKFEENFFEDPTKLAELVIGVTEEIQKLGLKVIQDCLEDMDHVIRNSIKRKMYWYIDRNEKKSLFTSLGIVTFTKTLFLNKESGERVYLLDRVMGFEDHKRMSEDAEAKLLQEAVQTSYRRGGESASLGDNVSKQTVKERIHSLEFPKDEKEPVKKKEVEYLYIEADEDHIAKQFNEKKGDLEINENGYKNNCMIGKLVVVHEGIKPERISIDENGKEICSKRHRLISPHYFTRVCHGKENEAFWDEIYAWICRNYDITKIKKIYLNADGGSWIQTAKARIAGLSYVLDEFHLQKYLMKLTSHMKDSTDDARREIIDALKNNDKGEFKEICERLKGCLETETGEKRINESSGYILNNWDAARVRINREKGIVGSSTEGQVYHVLSERMSTRPMGWSTVGGSKMIELRAYYLNGGDMLELVRYQKKEMPKAVGLEEDILTQAEIFKSEKNKHGKLGKYIESMTHTTLPEIQKKTWYKAVMGELS